MITQKGATNRDLLISESEEQAAFVDLVRASNRLEGEMNRLFRPFDLTMATYAILRILQGASPEGLSCGEISTQLIAEVPDMTRLLDRLERLEYVYRERSPLDRRMVKVKITSRGEEIMSGLRVKVLEGHKAQFSGLSAEEIVQMRGLLKRLMGHSSSTNEVAGRGEKEEKRVIGI